jgi:hypothetical protein
MQLRMTQVTKRYPSPRGAMTALADGRDPDRGRGRVRRARRAERLRQVHAAHRFTTAMQADMIHVMHEGRVVESGAHAALAARGGRYAASWRLQMREADADA